MMARYALPGASFPERGNPQMITVRLILMILAVISLVFAAAGVQTRVKSGLL